jgi:hypothetical protein
LRASTAAVAGDVLELGEVGAELGDRILVSVRERSLASLEISHQLSEELRVRGA